MVPDREFTTMKIVLLGYMGSGKTTVGKRLAEKLGLPFIDLDDYIEENLNSSIAEIFAETGEIFFRREEHRLLKEIFERYTDFVLALGGGTPCYSNNMDLVLDRTDNVFYLKLSIPTLAERLRLEKDHRPLIKHLPDIELPEFIGKHLFERSPFYNRATHTLEADKMDEESLLKKIEEKLV